MSLLSEDILSLLQLLPNLYHLGGASWAGANGSLSNPIQETLESMAGEVTRVVDEQLKVCGYLYCHLSNVEITKTEVFSC